MTFPEGCKVQVEVEAPQPVPETKPKDPEIAQIENLSSLQNLQAVSIRFC